jgi:hypothetical protein
MNNLPSLTPRATALVLSGKSMWKFRLRFSYHCFGYVELEAASPLEAERLHKKNEPIRIKRDFSTTPIHHATEVLVGGKWYAAPKQ